ncbi:MAG: TlpA family protein disulfide reductase [Blastocatellales bacterium]
MSNNAETGNSSFWRPANIGLMIGLIILVGAIASALLPDRDSSVTDDLADSSEPVTVSRPSATPAGPMVSRPAPASPSTPRALPDAVRQASFKLINGKSKKLADYKGKVLIVDIWATWCGPCRQEIPHLIEMAKAYKSKGVEVIGLTTENPETDADLVKSFTEEFKINYQIGWINSPLYGGLMNGRGGIPQTLIIGRDGTVRNHFVGFHPVISVPQMKAALEAAL